MGDVCTGSPTQTVFATSTSQGVTVSQSTSQSLSVGQGSVVTRSVQSGTGWIITESSVGGSTETIQVDVPVTVSGEQQVFTVPISTLFAPCTSETPTSSTTSTAPTSTTPTSTTPTSTETPESHTSSTNRTSRSTSPTSNPQNTNDNTTPLSTTPVSTPNSQGGNSVSETGTLTTISAFSATTLPNGSRSTVIILSTSSIAPSGGLNGNNNSGNGGGGSNSNSGRAVAIGVGVAGGVIALIILIFGITWHIRRKRRNAIPLDDSEIWGTHHESKTPPLGNLVVNNHGPGYTYNPYAEARTTAYAPVPTMSPPRSRPMALAESDDNRLSAGSYGLPPAAAGLTAPLLGRAKTADEILYEAAREDLPRSRASSATASHHTRPSETGVSHRPHQSFAASQKTHGSLASRTSGSAVGFLDHPPASSVHSSLHSDAQAAQRFQDHMDAPVEPERPMSPVSIAAPRLAIVNPDVGKDP